MKYVHGLRTFTTQEMSILETLQELEDVIGIAKIVCHNESDFACKNLDEAEHYIPYLCKKIKIALKYVPTEIQEKEYL
ncbi:MAG: hypothetical protein MJ187_03665 [Alphaproteobacteria bacterium]|nr:hypothetical protein [Alphaproteobacteria bacterium]